jgi:hypothetical protein
LITLSFSAFDTYLPIHPTSETIKAQMRVGVSSTEEDVTIISKVHSEVQLVAWVAQNLAPEVTLVPYITCSKLHCFACFVWLEEFNNLHDLTLPHVAFDGCHGGLQPGWLPPSLETVAMEQILGKMSSRLQNEFTFKSSEKPTTIIVPSKSMEDIFQCKFRHVREWAVLILILYSCSRGTAHHLPFNVIDISANKTMGA